MTEALAMQAEQGILPDSRLFTVRLWPEALGAGRIEWRGTVTHVLSSETRYFREWRTLFGFLVAARAKQSGAVRQSIIQDYPYTMAGDNLMKKNTTVNQPRSQH